MQSTAPAVACSHGDPSIGLAGCECCNRLGLKPLLALTNEKCEADGGYRGEPGFVNLPTAFDASLDDKQDVRQDTKLATKDLNNSTFSTESSVITQTTMRLFFLLLQSSRSSLSRMAVLSTLLCMLMMLKVNVIITLLFLFVIMLFI